MSSLSWQAPMPRSLLSSAYIIQFWLSGSECYYWAVRTYTHDGEATTDGWEWFSITAFTCIFLVNACKVMATLGQLALALELGS